MIELVEARRKQVDDLCRRYRVSRLDVFGSAVDGRFDADRSDLDFLVEFQPMPPAERGAAYLGLWEDLETLFGRKVDLVELSTIENPYLLRVIARSRTALYAA